MNSPVKETAQCLPIVSALSVLLSLVGIISNLIIIIVFCATPKLLRSTVNNFVRELSYLYIVCCCAFTPLQVIQWALEYEPSDTTLRTSIRSLACLTTFIRSSIETSVMLILTIMVIDRLFTVLWPKCSFTRFIKKTPSIPCRMCHVASMLIHIGGTPLCFLHLSAHWSLVNLIIYQIALLLFLISYTVLGITFFIKSEKATSKTLKRIIWLVFLLNASYYLSTIYAIVSSFITSTKPSVNCGTAADLGIFMIFAIHPLLYISISKHFKRSYSRLLLRNHKLGGRCRSHGPTVSTAVSSPLSSFSWTVSKKSSEDGELQITKTPFKCDDCRREENDERTEHSKQQLKVPQAKLKRRASQ